MKSVLSVCAVVVLTLAIVPAALGTPVVIDFEEFRGPSTPPTPGGLGQGLVGDYYAAAYGLHFTGAYALNKSGTLNYTAYPPYSGETVVTDMYEYAGVITMTFDGTYASVGGYYTYGGPSGDGELNLTAYDSADIVVDSATLLPNLAGSGTPNAWIELTHADGIAKVVIDDGGRSYTLDDLTLDGREAPVPEASTLMLFGSGLSGFMFYARKRRLIKL
jgi:hypothetical protein